MDASLSPITDGSVSPRWVALVERFAGGRPSEPSFDLALRAQGQGWGQQFGWPAHLALAMLWLAGAAGPIGTVELLPIPLGVCVLLRMHATWRLLPFILRSRLFLLLCAFVAWGAVSLLWSGDRGKGVQELGNARWLWCFLGVVPVLHKRHWLIAALVVGTSLGMLSQALEAVGLRFGIEWLVWPHPPNPLEHARISGWWHHPVMGGIVLVGAFGLHLPAAVFGRGWRRWAGVAGVGATLVAMAATGTRSAWVAAVGLVVLMLGFAAVRMPRARAVRVLAGAAALSLIFGGVVWVAKGDAIRQRVSSVVHELGGALDRRDYASDSGARVQFAIWASSMIAERPLLGHGTGSYEHWVRASLAAQGRDAQTVRIAPQAHNTALHAWATLGLPGVLLLLAAVVVAAAGGVVAARSGAPVGHDWAGTYGAGPACALLGIVLVSCFDTIYVNIQPAAFTTALLCLCLPLAPRVGERGAV
ncbi:MAG: O-antigen ligase family protein [Phycisphaerales bacterium]